MDRICKPGDCSSCYSRCSHRDKLDTPEYRIAALEAENERLRAAIPPDAWKKAPCCICGYNGPGYYQPETHPCAARAEKAEKKVANEGRRRARMTMERDAAGQALIEAKRHLAAKEALTESERDSLRCLDAAVVEAHAENSYNQLLEMEKDLAAALARAEKAEAVLGDLTTKIDKHCEWCKERPDKIEFYCPLDAANAELPELLAAARADAVRGFAGMLDEKTVPLGYGIRLDGEHADSAVNIAARYLARKEPTDG
jgi:hypothetical protein